MCSINSDSDILISNQRSTNLAEHPYISTKCYWTEAWWRKKNPKCIHRYTGACPGGLVKLVQANSQCLEPLAWYLQTK